MAASTNIPARPISGDRRSFLAVGMATTVAVSVAAPAIARAANAKAQWDATMREYLSARAEEDAYDKAVWRPALNAERAGGPKIPAHANAEIERLADRRYEAEDRLFALPAPTLAALHWKMTYGHERTAGTTGWPNDWWAGVMADLRHLMGEA